MAILNDAHRISDGHMPPFSVVRYRIALNECRKKASDKGQFLRRGSTFCCGSGKCSAPFECSHKVIINNPNPAGQKPNQNREFLESSQDLVLRQHVAGIKGILMERLLVLIQNKTKCPLHRGPAPRRDAVAGGRKGCINPVRLCMGLHLSHNKSRHWSHCQNAAVCRLLTQRPDRRGKASSS